MGDQYLALTLQEGTDQVQELGVWADVETAESRSDQHYQDLLEQAGVYEQADAYDHTIRGDIGWISDGTGGLRAGAASLEQVYMIIPVTVHGSGVPASRGVTQIMPDDVGRLTMPLTERLAASLAPEMPMTAADSH